MVSKAVAQLERNYDLLKALHKGKLDRRQRIIALADADLLDVLCHCCKNVLNGNIPLNKRDKRLLTKHGYTVRKLAKRSMGPNRKNHVVQSGGFIASVLPAVLGPIIGAIASAL